MNELSTDKRDMAEMEKYYLARIETLENRVKELEDYKAAYHEMVETAGMLADRLGRERGAKNRLRNYIRRAL